MSCFPQFSSLSFERLHLTPAITLLPASLALLTLVGCGITAQNFDSLPGPSAEIKGSMHGGRAPITGVTVQVWAAGTGGYGSPAVLLAQTTTDGSGGFGFPANAYTCPQGNTPVYLTGQGGNPGLPTNPNSPTLVLAAGLSNCTSAKVTQVAVNEVTTIATAYALAQFFTPTLGNSAGLSACAVGTSCAVDAFGSPTTSGGGIVTYSTGLTNANSFTIPTLVTLGTGSVKTDNPDVLPEGPKIYTLANALASCVNSAGGTAGDGSACGSLFTDTTPPGGTAPTDTLQAAVQMALHPYQHATDIYDLGSPTSPFQFAGGLTSAPADLTLGVAYTSSAFKLAILPAVDTSNLAIDADGKVWLPSTSPAGIAVFDPSTSSFSGPFTSTAARTPHNIAIDHEGFVWVADSSAVRAASFTGTIPPISANYSTGLAGSTHTVAIGSDDTVVLPANINTVGARLESIGSPRTTPVLLAPVPRHRTTGIATSSEGANYYYLATRTGNIGYMEVSRAQAVAGPTTVRLTTPNPGGSGQIAEVTNPSAPGSPDFVMTSPLANTFCSYALSSCAGSGYIGMNGPQGIAVDGANYVWVANSNNASVTEIPGYSTTSFPYTGGNSGNPLHGASNGNTMVEPFGIGIDPSGNVWVSNQTAVAAGSPYVLSELVGAGAPTITPINAQIFGGVNNVGTRP